jgi:hypothetical protein
MTRPEPPSGEATLAQQVDQHDVIWVAMPFSKSELKRLARRRGLLTQGGVYWEEIRESLGLPDRPYAFGTGKHFAFHQGSRPWLARTSEEDDDIRQMPARGD